MLDHINHIVLWEDPALLVINKPAGLPTLVDGYNPDLPFLVKLLKKFYDPLWVVHRLDRDTSGVIIFARNPEAHRNLNDQFARHETRKTYHGLVSGTPESTEINISLPLRPNGDRRHRTVVDHQRGKPSSTTLTILESYTNHALVQAVPLTGRTHQIRAHLASIGHPLVNDTLYGGHKLLLSELKPGTQNENNSDKLLLDRIGLHAFSLQVIHPDTGKLLHFTAPYPKDFEAVIRCLQNC